MIRKSVPGSVFGRRRSTGAPVNTDGSAGDADYGAIGGGYSDYRRPEPAIARRIWDALGEARSVVNVGAGAGSYEPGDKDVTPVEPSAAMREQRPAHLAPAINAPAEALPFPDAHFDAAMATFTVHQWHDLERGLGEMRRVTRGPVVVLSCDPDALDRFWLHDYAPEVTQVEAARYPAITRIADALGGAEIRAVPIPLDCRDGFNEAYYGRPEVLLDERARLACSGWSFVPPDAVERFVTRLTRDLADGSWDRLYGHYRTMPFFDGPLRLIVARGG